MKLSLPRLATVCFTLGLLASSASAALSTAEMQLGNPALKSIGPLAFGPDGVLFVADTKSAAIFAIATGDTTAATDAKALKVEAINQKIAGLLGTTADQILINDLAVNPVSRQSYLSVSRGRGPDALPVLVRISRDGQPEVVALDQVKFSKAELPDAPSDKPVAPGARGTNPRQESITDIAFLDHRVVVAGLSNEEFSSTLRTIPFPFKTVAGGTTVEIYHGSHGRFETRAPVRTFVPITVGQETHLLAAYTCTPLVDFSVGELAPGAKVKGKTIAELGAGNRPIDMIVYQKDGKDFLLLANSSRGVMKIGAGNLAAGERIEAPVKDIKHEGMSFETLADWKGIEQLASLDPTHAVVLAKGDGGALNLVSMALP